ncbi:DUF6408 family protein [Streptomyces sp. NPDC089919]
MNEAECKSARRVWFRKVLIDVSAGVVSSLVLATLTAVARLLF